MLSLVDTRARLSCVVFNNLFCTVYVPYKYMYVEFLNAIIHAIMCTVSF